MKGLEEADRLVVEIQLGRCPRGAVDVAWRCPQGIPGVVKTAPRLPDGTPFPTTYYLTCPKATKLCSTLEGHGLMAEMSERLGSDSALKLRYYEAHKSYLADRHQLGESLGLDVPEIEGVSAGGMPDRVKCLHVLVAHSLAVGVGVNPLGDDVVSRLGEFWVAPCPCVNPETGLGSEQVGREGLAQGELP